jgi:hypothetical protein
VICEFRLLMRVLNCYRSEFVESNFESKGLTLDDYKENFIFVESLFLFIK